MLNQKWEYFNCNSETQSQLICLRCYKKRNYNFLLDSHLSCPHAGDNVFVKKGILKSLLLLCLETHPASV